ncbi:MAG: hypothetical protein Fur0024_1780 [Patescibacteria group bacterium]
MNEKIIPLILLSVGEILYLLSESFIAFGADKNYSVETFWKRFFISIFFTTISSSMILLGYYFGNKLTKNIWIVSVISICSVIVIEPIINFLVFKDFPPFGALIGFVLGFFGVLATIFL